MPSEHYDDLLLDYVFGLLDEPEAEALRVHVAGCTPCRTALAEAEKQRQLLARAARVIEAVPAFVAPGQDDEGEARKEPAQNPQSAAPSPGPAPAQISEGPPVPSTLALPQPKRRRLIVRYWPVWAAAAAIAVAAVGLNNAYQEGVSRQQTQIAQIRSEVKTVDDRFAALQKDVANKQQDKVRLARKHTPPQVNVLVPAQVVRDAPTPVHVSTRDGDGKPHEAEVTASLATAGGEILERLSERILGEGTLQFPSAKAAPAPSAASTQLRVEAQIGKQNVKIEETLRVGQPEHVTHLALNKSIYHTGEMLFFRTLTLERYSLKPPARALPLRFALEDPAGKPVYAMVWQTEAGGISGGQMALTTDLHTGIYTFRVSAADGNNALLLPEQRELEILGDDIAQGAIAKDSADAKNTQKPLGSSQVAAEPTIALYPEGGALVAGLVNRIYYRVQSPQEEPALSEGRLIVRAGQKVIYDAEPQHGLGWFSLTPDPREKYFVHLDFGTLSVDLADPFAKLGIKSEGLILHTPQSVSRDGDPLTLVLRNQGPQRRLLVQATCRGHMIDQRYLHLPAGSQEITLQPAAGVAGIIRATVWDVATDRPAPLAERLLYRIPAKRLDVACEITNGPGPYAAGSKVTMKLKATDEHQGASQTWMSAVVVDEKYRLQKKDRSLAAQFYLAGDVSGEELDNADLTLTDTPASWQALDLFLGTQGWRRFVQSQPATFLATAKPAAPTTFARNEAETTNGLYSLQNDTQTLQAAYQKNLQREVSELIDWANRERDNLTTERETRLIALGQALHELADFEDLPAEYLRLGLGILALALLVAGAIFLTVGLVRLIRKQEESPTPCFAAAFSCLFACLLLYLVAGRMPLETAPPAGADAAADRPAWPEFTAPTIPPPAPSQSSPPVGYFAFQAPQPAPLARDQQTKYASSPRFWAMPDNLAKQNDDSSGGAQALSLNQAQNSYPYGDSYKELFKAGASNQEMKSLYEQSAASQAQNKFRAVQQSAAAKRNVPAPAAPRGAGGFGGSASAAGAGGPKGAAAFGAAKGGMGGMGVANTANSYFREYAHRNAYQRGRYDLQDTLLWYPRFDCPSGQAEVSFDLPYSPATYRVLIYANDAAGRLGFYEEILEVRAGSRK